MTPRNRKLILAGVVILAGIAAVSVYLKPESRPDHLPPLPEWADRLDGLTSEPKVQFQNKVAAHFSGSKYGPMIAEELAAAGFRKDLNADGRVSYTRRDTVFPCIAERQISWEETNDMARNMRASYNYICP